MPIPLDKHLPRTTWFEPKSPAKGVAVVIHGLNTSPLRMKGIIDLLNEDGILVERVALSGHRGDMDEFQGVCRDAWLEDTREAYIAARKTADEKNLPLYFVGYSLGALINADLMSSSEAGAIRYDKMILFAPALATRWYTRLILAGGTLGSRYVAPSGAPISYRAYGGTPMSAYNSLFESKAAVRGTEFRNLNIPTLVFLDPEDELISPNSLENVLRKFKLTQWKLEYVDNSESAVLPHFHHLIIDEESVGQGEWVRVKRLIKQHLAL